MSKRDASAIDAELQEVKHALSFASDSLTHHQNLLTEYQKVGVPNMEEAHRIKVLIYEGAVIHLNGRVRLLQKEMTRTLTGDNAPSSRRPFRPRASC